jgi:mannose-6-phosphate isomerase-like protein (cupin superfamily)
MKVCKCECTHEERENMRGGVGATILDLVPAASLPLHTRLAGTITLKAGCSIGNHAHVGETEIYLFISGEGTVDDNGTPVSVKAGDVIFTGGGASHGVVNSGTEDLIFNAVIVTEA